MSRFLWPARTPLLRVVGLMSGTSCDGVDAALVEVARVEGRIRIHTLATLFRPYTPEERERILALCQPDAPVEEICRTHFDLGEVFAEAVLRVLEQAGCGPEGCDLVGSCGHTVWHVPGHSTLQLGEAAVIAERTGLPVVSNFRARDIAAGGQGAPLVPYVDYLLFTDPHRARAVQNIGGIANVTYLPAGGGPDKVVAFDTGPGNMVIDAVAGLLTGSPRDEGGALAARGRPHEAVLEELLAHPYFAQPPPKSTGREVFGRSYAEEVVARARSLGLAPQDVLATVTLLTARTIADAYRFLGPVDEVVLSGGGVHNPTLVRWLRDLLHPVAVRTSNEFGVDPDFKEAIAFAVLAALTAWGLPGTLPSATGARHPVILGALTV